MTGRMLGPQRPCSGPVVLSPSVTQALAWISFNAHVPGTQRTLVWSAGPSWLPACVSAKLARYFRCPGGSQCPLAGAWVALLFRTTWSQLSSDRLIAQRVLRLCSSCQRNNNDLLFPEIFLTLGVPRRNSQGAIDKYLSSELGKWDSFWITYPLTQILHVVVSLA